uniref:N-acetyltransferase domain-containing protein n=1 Tax=Panagrolaimus davidi TaxID=227884 RepID=A0A914QW50_9BILA
MNSNTCNFYDPGTNEPLSYVLNKFGQKVGLPLSDNLPTPPFPNLETVHGITCRLEPLKVHHAEDLLYAMAENDSDWTYLLTDRPKDLNEYRQLIENYNKFHDRVNVAIVDNKTNKAVGSIAYMRIDPTNCSLEIGAVNFSKAMQKTKMGTEAIYLMMKVCL